jgi:hypothetical protein
MHAAQDVCVCVCVCVFVCVSRLIHDVVAAGDGRQDQGGRSKAPRAPRCHRYSTCYALSETVGLDDDMTDAPIAVCAFCRRREADVRYTGAAP